MGVSKLNLSMLGKVKLALHTLQALVLLVAIILFIAMAAQTGKTDGRGRFYGIMSFLTIPFLIYLASIPMWERTQRFANVFAFLAIDAILAILWLAAWASMVSWVRAGQAAGAAEMKLPGGSQNCTTFELKDFGTPKKCDLANDCVGFGVVLFVLFIPTAVISYLYLRKIQKDSSVTEPWLGKNAYAVPGGAEDANKDPAWSTDMHDDTGYGGGYDAQHNRTGSAGTEHGGDKEEDEFQLLHGSSSDSIHRDPQAGAHPGRPWEESRYGRPESGDVRDEDTSYGGGAYHAPSALSPTTGYSPHETEPYPQTPYGYNAQPQR
ncbi:hypothetical protein BT63DRAFT_455101 [Microthyrium microscopicum]|uniref:MARVEL domain-containing protein n=1 Tax=Microthyrium microscopicum TaxID=703497 RepID=A0A6A6UBX1_9PEZI|nr:hypothetical protein BT63DRAFT_455101 [Microthyrium microscopicum]